MSGVRIVTGTDLVKNLGFGIGAIFAYSFNGEQPNRDNLVSGEVKMYQATRAELQEFIDNA